MLRQRHRHDTLIGHHLPVMLPLPPLSFHSLGVYVGHGRPHHRYAGFFKGALGEAGVHTVMGSHHQSDRNVLLHGTDQRRGKRESSRVSSRADTLPWH